MQSICLCLRTITFEQNDLWRTYMAWWFMWTLTRSSCSYVKVTSQSSRSREENVPFSGESESKIEKKQLRFDGRKAERN